MSIVSGGRSWIVVAAAALLLAGASRSAGAATFTVNSSGDAGDASPGNGICATAGGVCTLRAAVEEANALNGADSITVPAMTIVLGSVLVVDKPGIAAPLAITGAGSGQTVLDGNGAVRVLEYKVASGPHSLSGLTIRNARSSGNGGGVLNVTTLAVTDVEFQNNIASQGGAIFNETAGAWVPELTLTNVTFVGNQGTSSVFGQGGGALFNGAKLTATQVTFSGNSSQQGGAFYNNSFHPAVVTGFSMTDNTARYGGGLDNDLGDVTLRAGVISGNVASCCGVGGSADYTGGGGIYHNQGSLTLEDVAFIDNRATSAGGYGGGLYSFEDATLTRVSFVGNRAAFGAAVYAGNFDGTPGTLDLTNVTMSGNVGVSSSSPFIQAVGGGLYVNSNCQATLTNSTITGNSAVVAGGIERLSSATGTTVTLRNTILAGNTGSSGSPDCRGPLVSGGYNLVQQTSGCGFSASTGDQTGVDPRLLAPVGQPAHHPLRLDSPAADAASGTVCPPADGRGQSRPQGGACDVGAFERGDAPGLADLGGNGRADVLWREASTGTTFLWSMNGAAIASSHFTTGQADSTWQLMRLADFSGDGKADILWRYRSTGETVVWTMNGTTVSGAAYTTSVAGPEWAVVDAADFDGDGTADILWREPTSGATYIWFMNGATVASAGFTTSSAGPGWYVAAVADLTGDGSADILWRESSSGLTYLWVMNGTTVSGGSGFTTASAGLDWSVEGAGDFGGDGRADLLWRGRSAGGTVIWSMDGAIVDGVGFTTAAAGLAWEVVGVADFTGDVKADILWRETSGGATYLWVMDELTVSAGTGFTSAQTDNAWQARHPR